VCKADQGDIAYDKLGVIVRGGFAWDIFPVYLGGGPTRQGVVWPDKGDYAAAHSGWQLVTAQKREQLSGRGSKMGVDGSRSRRRARSHSSRVEVRTLSRRRRVSSPLRSSATPASSETGTDFSSPVATSRTRTSEPVTNSKMITVWPSCAAATPGAISNRCGISGVRLATRRFPSCLIMEAENFAWS
jgi:hypothetical protein